MKNIRYILFAFTALCLFQSASYIKNEDRLICGNWRLVEKGTMREMNYERIEFYTDGMIVLSSRADTLFRYRYKVSNSDLLIFGYGIQDTLRCHILKLTQDSLMLATLGEKNIPQTYYRCQIKK